MLYMEFPWTSLKTRMEALFAKYGQVEEVCDVISKSGIVTGDIVLQMTMTLQSFEEIPNDLMCRDKRMLCTTLGHNVEDMLR